MNLEIQFVLATLAPGYRSTCSQGITHNTRQMLLLLPPVLISLIQINYPVQMYRYTNSLYSLHTEVYYCFGLITVLVVSHRKTNQVSDLFPLLLLLHTNAPRFIRRESEDMKVRNMQENNFFFHSTIISFVLNLQYNVFISWLMYFNIYFHSSHYTPPFKIP